MKNNLSALVIESRYNEETNEDFVTVVDEKLIKEAVSKFESGDFNHAGRFYLVPRANGTNYPMPLLFASQSKRESVAHNYNETVWAKFYGGKINSEELKEQLRDCPEQGGGGLHSKMH